MVASAESAVVELPPELGSELLFLPPDADCPEDWLELPHPTAAPTRSKRAAQLKEGFSCKKDAISNPILGCIAIESGQ